MNAIQAAPASTLIARNSGGQDRGGDDPPAGFRPIRRPTRPRPPRPRKPGNTLAVKRLANRESSAETMDVADYGYRFYDPVTGRWPSRDPIGENGGENLYALSGNDAIGLVDILGFAPLPNWHDVDLPGKVLSPDSNAKAPVGKQAKCVCGPDITDAIRATLDNVSERFKALGQEDRDSVCDTMFLGYPLVIGIGLNWDIDDLKTVRTNVANLCGHQDKDNSRSCQESVTINGECHYGGTVNYILFGHMGRICNKFSQQLFASVLIWKTDANVFSWPPKPYPHHTYPNSRDWTQAGFTGWLTDREYKDSLKDIRPGPGSGQAFVVPRGSPEQLAPRGDRPSCEPCNKSVKNVMSWHIGRLANHEVFRGP